jgi:hypothetical protein
MIPATIALTLTCLIANASGCSADGGGGTSTQVGSISGPAAGAVSTESVSIAKQIAASNSATDQRLNLLVRKYLNDETEVVEFYEPQPGQIIISTAGSPVQHSVLPPLRGKTAAEVWTLVAPGEALPESLADAILRQGQGSLLPAKPQATTMRRSSSTGKELIGPAVGQAPSAPVIDPASVNQQLNKSGGYCSSQFWTDFTNWCVDTGDTYCTVSQAFNYGYYGYNWTDITADGYAVCPQDDWGWFGWSLTDGWNVPADTYRTETQSDPPSCGYNLFCLGTECTPNFYNVTMTFDSHCYLEYGTSCGYNFDYITWDNWWGVCGTGESCCM